jgi:hypothetical protein
MAWGTNIGYWAGEINKYLALKLIVGANTFYGWVRLDVLSTSTSFTIKDYAYESSPDACIETGQIPLDIDGTTTRSFFSVFPNPIISSTTLKTTNNLKNANLEICNSYGQIVKRVSDISGQSVFLSRDHLPGGLYFIRLKEENRNIAVEKVLIID